MHIFLICLGIAMLTMASLYILAEWLENRREKALAKEVNQFLDSFVRRRVKELLGKTKNV